MSKALDKLQTVFSKLFEEEKKMKGKDPCWKGYEMVGMKKKNGKEVPNCVPKNEEVELNEGRPSQRHPLEGHEYHKKTDAQLEYIAKDAHKAAEAMKSHNNTDAENKYRDQANDSATVRYWRKKNGMPDWYKKKYGHMKEEVEQIDELSKDTLKSYTKKANDEVNAIKKKQADHPRGHISGADADKKLNRQIGINQATKRIVKKDLTGVAEEVEQIDELSKDTLKSYKHKAGQDARAHSSASLKAFKQGDEEKGDAHFNKSYKRVIGVAKAIDKLQNKGVKEEVEITEAKGDLTYKPEHAKWGVVPKSSKEFVKFFPKDKEAAAKAHAEKTGGTLKKIDQAGRAMREDVELDEVSQDALRNYFKKSVADLSKRQIKMNTGSADSNDAKKMQDRKKGLSRASDKIASKMEEVELDEAFSDAQIARLKAEYSKISGIDPDSESYKKLIALLDRQDKATLQKLADSGIKFISGLARNRVIRMKEDVELDLNQLFTEAMKVKKKSEETPTKKSIKKGEPLSGKQEPVKVHPEIQTRN